MGVSYLTLRPVPWSIRSVQRRITIKTIKWIKGDSAPNKFSDGEETAPIRTFWHIRKPRTTETTMCGVKLHGAVVPLADNKVKKTPKKEFCSRCPVAAGLEPMFGPSLAGDRASKGTRATAHTGARQNTGKSVQVG